MGMDGKTRLTRRDAIRTGLAAAGILAIGSRVSRGDDPGAGDGYAPFKMGIQSYSLRHFKLEEALEMTRRTRAALLGVVPRPYPDRPVPGREVSGDGQGRRRECHRLRRDGLLQGPRREPQGV